MAGIKKELLTGVAYIGTAKYAGMAIQLIVAGILGRLLSPDDFGTVATVMVFVAFFAIFTDIGIGPAVIQYKDLNKEELASIFSFTIWGGTILAVLFFLSSWSIAAYYHTPVLAGLCRVLSLNLLFSTWNIVPNALLYKEKRFGFIATRSFLVQFLSGAIAITAAWWGAGMYALLVNPVLSGMALFLINYLQYPLKIRLNFSRSPLKKIFSFSLYQFLFNLVNYFSLNLDKLLTGKYLGMVKLGYYEKSYRLMMLPLQNITFVITPVMHPIFSDFQNDLKKLAESYLKITRLLAFIGFPLTVVLISTATELMLLLFGPQWGPSVGPFRLLALTVGIQILLSTTGSIFQAAGATRMMFYSGFLSSALNVGGILLGVLYFKTLEALAACIVITFSVNFIQAYVLLFIFTLKYNLLCFIRQLISPFILSILLAIVLYFINLVVPQGSLLVSLVIKSCTALLVWLAYIQYTGEYDIICRGKEILGKWRKKL